MPNDQAMTRSGGGETPQQFMLSLVPGCFGHEVSGVLARFHGLAGGEAQGTRGVRVADVARRRYLAVDPNNRLVADSLEADWNDFDLVLSVT